MVTYHNYSYRNNNCYNYYYGNKSKLLLRLQDHKQLLLQLPLVYYYGNKAQELQLQLQEKQLLQLLLR